MLMNIELYALAFLFSCYAVSLSFLMILFLFLKEDSLDFYEPHGFPFFSQGAWKLMTHTYTLEVLSAFLSSFIDSSLSAPHLLLPPSYIFFIPLQSRENFQLTNWP